MFWSYSSSHLFPGPPHLPTIQLHVLPLSFKKKSKTIKKKIKANKPDKNLQSDKHTNKQTKQQNKNKKPKTKQRKCAWKYMEFSFMLANY